MVINDDPILKTKKKYLTAVLDEDKIILFSSETGLGADTLTALLESYM